METRIHFQQAWLVTDLASAAEHWSVMFGAGPFFAVPHHRTDVFRYRGTTIEADVSYAFGYLGDMMIQLIEQHDDQPSIYRDMYGPGEAGFHHVAYLTHDFAAERARLLEAGHVLACELYADGVNAAYFDTRAEIGCFTEIHGDPAHILGIFGLWRRAYALRTAATPALLPFEAMPQYEVASID